ncbi:MAG: threonine/serine exporter family protein [Rikenellaceae bacterium]|nr:threonine/serine exporter family protein [Rikenellaceae bacterium]
MAAEIQDYVHVVLAISTLLMESGAHCNRIERNIQRIAERAGYCTDLLMSFTAITVSATDRNDPGRTATGLKRVHHHGIHFGIVTRISHLSWSFYEGSLSFEELQEGVERIRLTPRYNPWAVRAMVGIACGCLCFLNGGNTVDAVFAGSGAFAGLLLRQTMNKAGFNLLMGVLFASLVSTAISSLDAVLGLGLRPEAAVATTVLYLVPGIPLINCVIDLVEGYYPPGIARGVFGSAVLFCIAVGMFVCMTLIGINYY